MTSQRELLDDALFVMQSWVTRNAPLMTEADRTDFSQALTSEKNPQQRNGSAYGDDGSLVASILRVHTMRLLFRYDAEHDSIAFDASDDTSYGRASRQLREALRNAEQAMNEARVDTAIANAHQIMGDANANHRWLQDALARLQAAAKTDLLKMVESIPPPAVPTLNIVQRAAFSIFGIKPAEITRRNLHSLHQIAELQTNQLIEMAHLLVSSFEAIDDQPGVTQSLALITRLHRSSR